MPSRTGLCQCWASHSLEHPCSSCQGAGGAAEDCHQIHPSSHLSHRVHHPATAEGGESLSLYHRSCPAVKEGEGHSNLRHVLVAHKEERSRMEVVLVGSGLVMVVEEQVVVEDQEVVGDPMHLKP